MKRLVFALGFFSLVACTTLKFTATGPEYQPRGAKCPFRVFSTQPPVPYEELGVIDVQTSSGLGYTDIAEFRKAIQPHVCKAGGDGAITFANGNGSYVKATVIVLKPAAEAPSAAPPAASTPLPVDE